MRVLMIILLVWGVFFHPICQASEFDSRPEIVMVTWRGKTRAETGFVQGLENLGYSPSYTIFNCRQNLESLNQMLPRIKEARPDLIYVFGTTATKQVVAAIKDIPVIFNIVTRPVESGIIESWRAPGNNATGVSSMVPLSSQIKALKKVVPFTRLGVIYNPVEQNSVIQVSELNQLARIKGFKLVHFRITSDLDIISVLDKFETKVDAIYFPSDSTIKTLGQRIVEKVNAGSLPSLAALEEMVTSEGAMMGLVPDYYHLGGLAAQKADAVLNGSHPSRVPAVTSEHFSITVNLKTAKKIGVHLPTGILVMADKIVR